ncbi:MAG: HdeA/HdeB family chaperone [Tabrizicola sp.]
MKLTLTTIALLAAAAVPSLAVADDMDPAKMTCAEFSKMDKDGMMKAIDAMHMAGPDASMKMDMAAQEEAMKMTTEHCKDKPDMMAMDAMMMK